MSNPATTEQWWENFENEEYAPIVVVYPEEKLVAKFLESNVIPQENLNGEIEDREVVKCEVLAGSNVTDREFKDTDKRDDQGKIIKEQVGKPKPVKPGEIRSFWISTEVLKKAFISYNPKPGEQFAVANKGMRRNKKDTASYNDWRMVMPRAKETKTVRS